jgi:hypothetical protein
MSISSTAVAERNKRAEEQRTAFTWCLAATLGIALVGGISKMVVDLKATKQGTRRRKQPWELT